MLILSSFTEVEKADSEGLLSQISNDLDPSPPGGPAPESATAMADKRHSSSDRNSSDQIDGYAGGYFGEHRRGEVSHGIVALVSTIVGGGSLSIPWAFAQSGAPAGLGILALSAAMSAMGVHFLLSGARRAGGLKTFDQVLEAALGPWARALTIGSVIATCFLTLCANSLLLRQLANALFAGYILDRPLVRSEQLTLGTALVCAVVPLTYLETLNKLRHLSLLSVATVTALVAVLAFKGFTCDPGVAAAVDAPPVGGGLSGIISSLPVFTCIFICSFSALPLDTELRQPSRQRMNTMVIAAFLLASLLYLVAGLSGVAYASCTAQPVTSNVLAMFPAGDPLASVLRLLLSLILMLSLPLICLPCRTMLFELLRGCTRRCKASCCPMLPPSPFLRSRAQGVGTPVGGGGNGVAGTNEWDDEYFYYSSDGEMPLTGEDSLPAGIVKAGRGQGGDARMPWRFETAAGPDKPNGMVPSASASSVVLGEVFGSLVGEEQGSEPTAAQRIALSSAIMGSTIVCTALVDDVSIVWGFLGSTCGLLLSYILPAASYLLLRRKPRRGRSSVPMRKLAALVLVVVGLVLTPILLTDSVQHLLEHLKMERHAA